MSKNVKLKTKNLKFSNALRNFFKENRSEFPWRKTHDPYEVLVSEMMLQQTQTRRVITKYAEFLNAFPTVSRLAKAS